ncbi:MAG TPA: HAD family phosphatase [Niabella sp.]|nr:HAD family phosphatase [Niabella sp.]HOZ95832.1 HAD family phosphatase [Niabella sp.]HQW13686.1 HAD family phosphatase [Niabella sp.]HQX19080.1 HAD family phosphatase [Niabella sp.]HQX42367.1 HAD family phosphatase [Niabella sp.]
MKYKAFLFDLNGTMIDDMEYHIKAWYRILNELGAYMSMEKTKEECYGKNFELLERIFPNRFSEAEKFNMSLEKEKQYQTDFKPYLKLIAGLDQFLRLSFDSGIKMAIGSAAIMYNIDFVLDGLKIRRYFDAIVSADDVNNSKPNPETYQKCAKLLQMAPQDCLVFEDAPKGVEAALNAGMDCVVLTTMHQKEEFEYPNIISFESDFNRLAGTVAR